MGGPFCCKIKTMYITKEQYEYALARVEELLPTVDDNTPANSKYAVELSMVSDVTYCLIIRKKRHDTKELAGEIWISPSRISDYVSDRSEPTLKIARRLCRTLEISPVAVLG